VILSRLPHSGQVYKKLSREPVNAQAMHAYTQSPMYSGIKYGRTCAGNALTSTSVQSLVMMASFPILNQTRQSASVSLFFRRNRHIRTHTGAGPALDTGILINCIVPVKFFNGLRGTDFPTGPAHNTAIGYKICHASAATSCILYPLVKSSGPKTAGHWKISRPYPQHTSIILSAHCSGCRAKAKVKTCSGSGNRDFHLLPAA